MTPTCDDPACPCSQDYSVHIEEAELELDFDLGEACVLGDTECEACQ